MARANDPLEKSPSSSASDLDDERKQRIREAAYRRAEARGFAPGGEFDDWIAAEHEVNDMRGDSSLG
jgi:hypothetical protein